MKGFYDKILPAAVNKFFNKPIWGNAKTGVGEISKTPLLKVETDGDKIKVRNISTGKFLIAGGTGRDMMFESEMSAEQYIKLNKWDKGIEVWTLPITPEMQDKALYEGMPVASIREVEPAGLREWRLNQQALRKQTGQTTPTELENLGYALKKSMYHARKAFAAGDKAGVAKENQRMNALIKRAKDRREQSAESKKMLGQIKTALMKTKVKKKKGRFGAERQVTLDRMRSWLNFTQDVARTELTNRLGSTVPPDMFGLVENKLLAVLGGLRSADQSLLDDINNIKQEGILSRELKKQNRLAYIEIAVEEAVAIIGGVDEAKKSLGIKPSTKDKSWTQKVRNALFASGATNFIQAWDDILDIISYGDKSSKPGESIISKYGNVHEEENVEKQGNMNMMESFQKLVIDTYGLKNTSQMIKMFNQDSVKQDLGIFTNLNGDRVQMLFTKAEARKTIMSLLDPSLYETFFDPKGGMHWSQDMVTALYNMMTQQDLDFIQAQMKWYQGYYKSINDIYSEIYGVNLPNNPFYSPISREGVNKEEDAGLQEFLKDAPFRASADTAGSLKARTVNRLPITQQSDILVLTRHVTEMEHFKAWSQKIRDLNAVFNHIDVRTAIAENYGQSINQHIEDTIQDLASGGNEKSRMYGFWDKIRVKYTQSVLAVKPSLFLKQLSSVVAYADAIPAAYWSKEFTKVLLPWNLKAAAKELFEGSTMVRNRWARGTMERDIAAAARTDEYAAFKASPSFMNKLMYGVRLGDMAAIIAGGYPVYKYYLKKTGSKEQAIRHFESVTSSTQQSADISKLSSMQRGNSFMKLFTMFKTSPTQYLRKEIAAVRNLSAGRISPAQFAKTIVIYHFILPLIFQTMSEMIIGGDDDDDSILTKGQKRSMILGSLNGYFIVGDALDYIIKQCLGMYAELPTIAPIGVARDVAKALRLFNWNDLEDEEMLSAVRGLAGATGAATGVPLKQVVDIGTGVSDVLAGDYEKGIMEIAGWSPTAAGKAIEE